MSLLVVKNGIDILKLAISNEITLSLAALELNFNRSYVTDVKRRIDGYLDKGTINKDLYDEFFYWVDIFNGDGENGKLLKIENIGDTDLITISPKNDKHDKDLTDEFNDRSYYDIVRDDNEKIVKYRYVIYVRDCEPLTGELTREQMETIYSHYPYVTQNTCSSYFPTITFINFKKILRVFNITKDKLFPQHILEEKSAQEVADLTLKYKEHAAYKKLVEQKPLHIEKTLRDVQKELFELKEDRKWVKQSIEEVLKDINEIIPVNLNYSVVDSENALFIYLSDHHVGASNNGTQYDNTYSKEVYLNRLKQILNEVLKQKHLYKRFDKVYVVSLGDCLDGFSGETTRGGHHLPQNMNNREQFKVYVDSMIMFFEELHKMDLTNNLEFISVAESNHGGDFEYSANLMIKYLFELKFPDVNVNLFDKNIEHIQYGDSTFIYTHGKDNDKMTRNMPLHIDPKLETFFTNYCKMNKIKTKYINVVKGDLHQYSTEIGKNFRYTNVPSIFGASGWIMANFGYTQPAFVFQVVNKNIPKLIEGYIELE
jgi:hypothetical protein